MKFTVNREKLQKALQRVGSIIGSRSMLPVLGNVMVQAEEGALTLTTTDLEIRISTRVEASVESAGVTTMPARKLGYFQQWPGAIFCALSWVLFSVIFSAYVSLSGYFGAYGVIGTVMVAMVWVYYCFYFLLLGGYINHYIARRRTERSV